MLVYACGVCNKIPEKSRIPVSMSWVHAVIFAHWKEQKYRVSAGMFPHQKVEICFLKGSCFCSVKESKCFNANCKTKVFSYTQKVIGPKRNIYYNSKKSCGSIWEPIHIFLKPRFEYDSTQIHWKVNRTQFWGLLSKVIVWMHYIRAFVKIDLINVDMYFRLPNSKDLYKRRKLKYIGLNQQLYDLGLPVDDLYDVHAVEVVILKTNTKKYFYLSNEWGAIFEWHLSTTVSYCINSFQD